MQLLSTHTLNIFFSRSIVGMQWFISGVKHLHTLQSDHYGEYVNYITIYYGAKLLPKC